MKGSVERLAFGGNGILHNNKLVIFVPFTAPGDLITYRILKQKASYAIGELISIEEPGPARTRPLCPYFGRCGGCQLQHINYNAQLEHKQQCVQDALSRIGKLQVPQLPPPSPSIPWSYRRHVHLNIQNGEAGYIAYDNQSLVKVEQCPIFTDPQVPILKQAQEIIKQLDCKEGRLSLYKLSINRYLLHFHFKQKPPNVDEVIGKALIDFPQIAGVIVNKKCYGTVSCVLSIEGLQIAFSSGAFLQNNPEQSLAIYRHVCRLAEDSSRILDLYSGIGCSTLLLSKQAEMAVGVEFNPEAVQLAINNAELNNIKNVRFLCEDASVGLEKIWESLNPEFVLMNPPRNGVDESLIKHLCMKKPQKIAYISCNPATLARDLKRLCEKHYQLKTCNVFDMFPQTGHIETVALLTRIS